MNLYRIMLVDDEEEVRKSIIKKIDWEDAGFQVVGDAENGEEALEKLEQLEPDVILTDIRMPYMDGLTMAERVRQKSPSVKILIFSGFDDFEYAKQAIKLNVTEYILKPVNVEEMTAILKRVKASLDEEIEQRRDVSLLRESYRSSLPIIREHFLGALVHGEEMPEEIESKLKQYQIPIADARKWVVAVVDVEPGDEGSLSLHREQELIPISVKKLLDEKLGEYCRHIIFDTAEEIVVIAAIDEENTQTGLIDLLGDLCKETKRILEVTVTIGVGCSCGSLETLHTSFRSAVNALGYQAIVGSGGVIYINDVEPVSRGKLQFGGKEEAELISAAKFGGREAIDRAILNIVGQMEESRVHYRQRQAYMLSVVNCIVQMIQQYNLELNEMFGEETDYFKMIFNTQKKEDIVAWLTDVTCRIYEALNQERDNTTKNVIRLAEQYIQDNYQNPDLSVEMLCRHLHMSPAYFSTVFKRETGQAYIAYLTDIRLNKAVELLNKTDDKTYVIAAKVGYQEQNYFSYVFKKKFGVSPTKYRGNKK